MSKDTAINIDRIEQTRIQGNMLTLYKLNCQCIITLLMNTENNYKRYPLMDKNHNSIYL